MSAATRSPGTAIPVVAKRHGCFLTDAMPWAVTMGAEVDK
jgi:hypothetical protein